MANPADEWSSADLKALKNGGLINEDVMQKIWDISRIPLPFTDLIGTDSHTNAFMSWTQDELAAPDITNAVIDGADASGNDAAGGVRVGNHSQISDKVVSVTQRANNSDTIGRSNELSYQLMMRQQELKRDVEAIMLLNQASIADDGDTVAGLSGGFPSWLETNTSSGTGGSDGGFNTTTALVAAATAGDARVLTEGLIRDAVEDAYIAGGNVTHLMTSAPLVRRLNTFLFSSGASIATPTSNVAGTGGTKAQTGQGYINAFITDFGTTLVIEPNRLQQTYNSGDTTPVPVVDTFLIDPSKVALSVQQGLQVEPIAKTGLADKRQMSMDWSLKVYSEAAHAVIRDCLPTGTVTA
jgi:hypothetical protein